MSAGRDKVPAGADDLLGRWGGYALSDVADEVSADRDTLPGRRDEVSAEADGMSAC